MNKKTSLILAILAIVIVAVGLFAYYSSKGPSVEELVISGHPAWPPIMYQEGTAIVGAGPEIVEKVFADLGVTVVSRYEGTWEEVQEKAKEGSVDVLVAAYRTPEREAYMDYSIPYTVDPVVLVVKEGQAFPYEKWEDLVGKKGVVTTGDSYGQDFDAFLRDNLSPQAVATPAEAFSLLESGEADYFVYALYSAQSYIAANGLSEKFEIIPNYVSAENFHLTISKASPFVGLLPQVNDRLEQYMADGTIVRMIEENKQTLGNR